MFDFHRMVKKGHAGPVSRIRIRIRIQSDQRIRIRIGSGFNQVTGSGSGSKREKMTHKSRKNLEISCSRCSLLRAEGFFCSVLDPKPWIRIRIGIQPKMLDLDPCQMNMYPKHW
jgi:hypothetical protein